LAEAKSMLTYNSDSGNHCQKIQNFPPSIEAPGLLIHLSHLSFQGGLLIRGGLLIWEGLLLWGGVYIESCFFLHHHIFLELVFTIVIVRFLFDDNCISVRRRAESYKTDEPTIKKQLFSSFIYLAQYQRDID
jgi:hypothetical protein